MNLIKNYFDHMKILFFKNSERTFLFVAQAFSAFLMLALGKIIAVYFLPHEFGRYNLQMATYILFFSVLIGPVVQFIKVNNNSLNRKIGLIHYLPLLGFLILIMISSLFFILEIKNIEYSYYLFLLAIVFVFFDLLNRIFIDNFNTSGSFYYLGSYDILNKFLLLLSLSFLIYYFEKTHSNYLWANMIASTILTAFIGMFVIDIDIKRRFVVSLNKLYKKVLRYCLPLSIMSLFSWCVDYFDRFAIDYYLDLNSVGIYNASYSLGSKFLLISVPVFISILSPLVYRNINVKSKKKYINDYFKKYIYFSLGILFVIHFSYDFIGNLFLSADYAQGFFLISGINFAYFFLTASFLFEMLLYSENKTKYILYVNILAAGSNVILNIIFIPKFGIIGAMYATIFSFFLKFIFTLTYYNRL